MVFNHTDMYLPFGDLGESPVEGQVFYDSALSDMRAGEALLAEVHTSIKDAAAPTARTRSTPRS